LIGIVLRHLQGNAREVERVLTTQTGLDWRIGNVEYRTLSVARLKNVELRDTISGKTIFVAPEIDVSLLDVEIGHKYFEGLESEIEEKKSNLIDVVSFFSQILPSTHKRNIYCHLSIPKSTWQLDGMVRDESAGMFHSIFLRLLARFPEMAERPVMVTLDEMAIVAPQTNSDTIQIRFVQGTLFQNSETNRLQSDWSFQIPSVSELESQKLSVKQHRITGELEIAWQTGVQPVPSSFLSIFSSVYQRFGDGSLFSGNMTAQYRPSHKKSWTIILTNAFLENLPLSAFAEEYNIHAVKGTVKGLQVDRAVFSQGDMSAEGWLEIVGGTLEKTLFMRMVDHFELRVEPASILDVSWNEIPFDQCTIYFKLQQDGAFFRAQESNDPQNSNLLMVRKGDGYRTHPMAVFFKGNQNPVSYHSILSVLAPDSAPIVPVTPLSKMIFSMIPDSANPVIATQYKPRHETPESQFPSKLLTYSENEIKHTPEIDNIATNNLTNNVANNATNNVVNNTTNNAASNMTNNLTNNATNNDKTAPIMPPQKIHETTSENTNQLPLMPIPLDILNP
ncbi:MAG: hypothetical protein ACRCUY_12420, partial [Thermoguttaceae bacterium]